MATNIAHQDVVELKLSVDTARKFILTPERILDYFPDGAGGGVFEANKTIYCYNEAVVSLLERVSAPEDNPTVIKVTSAPNSGEPYSAEAIKEAAFFTMMEDWLLEETATGVRLSKTWRDIETPSGPSEEMNKVVRESAIAESAHLVAGWNNAAAS